MEVRCIRYNRIIVGLIMPIVKKLSLVLPTDRALARELRYLRAYRQGADLILLKGRPPTFISAASVRFRRSATCANQTSLFQKPVQHCAQRHWIDRLVEQMIAAVLCLLQQCGADVSADEKGRDRDAECGTHLFDRLDAGALVGEKKVGNDKIGRAFRIGEIDQRLCGRASGDHSAPQLRSSPSIASSASASSSITTM